MISHFFSSQLPRHILFSLPTPFVYSRPKQLPVCLTPNPSNNQKNKSLQISLAVALSSLALFGMDQLLDDTDFTLPSSTIFLESTNKIPFSTFSWGRSTHGQLGHGTFLKLTTPQPISMLEGENIQNVYCSGLVSATLTTDGQVFTWGSGLDSALGHNDDSNENLPRLVESLSSFKIVQLAVGPKHIVALDENGNIYTAGSGYTGRLLNDGSDHLEFKKVDLSKSFSSETSETSESNSQISSIIKIAAGGDHTLLLTQEGKVYQGGLKRTKRMSKWEKYDVSSKPILLDIPEKIIAISAGNSTSAAISESGNLYMWGYNKFAQLGLGKRDEIYHEKPTLVRRLKSQVVQVAVGQFHVLALTKSNEVYSWGRGSDGQTGHGTPSDSLVPSRIESLDDKTIISIAAGGYHSGCVVLSEDGSRQLYLFGRGSDGQLGDSKLGNVLTPQPLVLKETISSKDDGSLSKNKVVPYDCESVALGQAHTIALLSV